MININQNLNSTTKRIKTKYLKVFIEVEETNMKVR